MFRRSAREMRVLILAPIGRDAELLAQSLTALQIETAIAPNATELQYMLEEGAGASIIADEAVSPSFLRAVSRWLEAQPPWSDPPFVVLTSAGEPTSGSARRAEEFQALGNLTLIERPLRPETIQSAARTALRARMRQYEVRSRQEALIQAIADLEQFAHSASHDLREPLRTIGIYSDLLAAEYGERLDDRGREFMTTIHAGARRMDALLADLLSYAHASGISEDGVEPVSAMRPLESVLESLAGAIEESQAELTIGEMPVVRIRESHLSQIFQNLIGNAIKYRRENEPPRIHVQASRGEEHWIFSVGDNGIGVPQAYRDTIFGIFKRLHASSKYSGTGMGLAICQRIVERYRGRIWVESEPGRGSTFLFTLPA